jgi:hypothetical protein
MNLFSGLPRKKIASRLVVLFAWAATVSLFNLQLNLNLLFLWLGGLLGLILIEIDQLLYVFYFHPQEEASLQVKTLIKQKRFKTALTWLAKTAGGRWKLSFHNVLFQAIFAPFSFLVLTSSGNLLGTGIVMAINISLLMDQVGLILKNQDQLLAQKYFWPVNFPLSLGLKKLWVLLMIVVFILLSLLMI